MNNERLPMSYLKPHDLAVALQLAIAPGLSYRALADAVGLSQGEVHNAVKRLASARLVRADTRVVARAALLEFITSGVQYAFAVSAGPEVRGVPTAHSAPALVASFADADPVVWPSALGDTRGAAIEPLYDAAVSTPTRNPALYERLAMLDAIRAGRARERQRARAYFKHQLSANGKEKT
jgi:DNA-binding Lrp family transcriptional regulator